MKENIKRKIIFGLVIVTILAAPLNIAWGVYFGVLTNVCINAFWNSKLFPSKKKEIKSERELIVESISPPKF